MGLNVTLRGDGREFSFKLTNVDSEFLSTLARLCPEEVAQIVSTTDFGDEVARDRSRLLQAVRTVCETVKAGGDKLPYVYEIKGQVAPGVWQGGSGGIGGIRLEGDPHVYTLWAGVGYCRLDKRRILEGGRGEVIETIDVTDRASLDTNNLGILQIRKRKAAIHLIDNLRKLADFLSELQSDTVIKIIG